MEHQELVNFIENSGVDPSRLIFEDELTGLYNRRYLYHCLQSLIDWDHLNTNPLSLLMLDLDHFKQVNDNYGHQVGDQALVWLSGHLKQIAGASGMPIRYAGDEFMILLKDTDKKDSLTVGEKLIQAVRGNPFSFNGNGGGIPLTISLGIASAPDDAQSGKELIQKADTALYSAKQNGRDKLVNAGEINPEQVFTKTAMYQLKEVQIVGRGRQLAIVAEALKKFSLRQSQFLVAEGAPGFGKTEFLDTIRRNLAKSKTWQASVSGQSQELYRPYYTTEKILVEILRQRNDKGIKVLQSLKPTELAYISRVLPQLKVDTAVIDEQDEKTQREGIFTTLLQLVPKLVDFHPLMIFIDDLHFTDEATLLLLRRLIVKGDFPLFVCSAAADSKEPVANGHSNPSIHFLRDYQDDLNIQRFALTPLTADDIAKHIQSLFPNVTIPGHFEKELARITQGNPLFFSEILRKLVLDQKITLTGKHWIIQPLDQDYLPKSLEEVVRAKIALLDEDERKMLDQVSALGEDVSLSMLAGSSEGMEARILEFIDKAAAQGLISSEFEVNDEIISFLGKQVLEITYNAIEPKRRERIHERIGNYQEKLYQQELLPSAATLAYHFKRSADREKAHTYETLLQHSNVRTFNAEEASLYTGAGAGESGTTHVPIRPDDVLLIPKVIRDFMVAVRNIKLYPPGSKSIIGVIAQSQESLERIFKHNEVLNLMQIKQGLVVNGQKMDVTDFKLVADGFLQFLSRYELKGIAFHNGMSARELEVLIETFGRTKEKLFDEHFWERFATENRLQHIELKQKRYTMSGKPPAAVEGQVPEMTAASGSAVAADNQPAGAGSPNLLAIPALLKGLLGAAKIIKLYPIQSKAVSGAVNQLMEHLSKFLHTQPVLTISHAGQTLLINGDRVDVSDYKTFAQGFIHFLDTIHLKSLAFVRGLKRSELETFLGILRELPPEGVDPAYWREMAEKGNLSGIVFDKHIYEISVSERPGSTAETGELKTVEIPSPADAEADEPLPKEAFTELLSVFAQIIPQYFERGDEAKIKQALGRLFYALPQRDLPVRETVYLTCRNLMESLPPAYQHDFAKWLTDPLLETFILEPEPKLVVDTAAFLNRMVVSLIGFGEYPPSARILSQLRKKLDAFHAQNDPNAQRLSKSMDIRLNPATRKLLVSDLKSGESIRQRNAGQLLESLGYAVMPLLIEIVKQEEDYRARQIGAQLLAKLGPNAAKQLKRLVVLEISPEERTRVLEIIDSVTTDLFTELVHALGDENIKVRMAAFQLAERLNDNRILGMLLENARSGNLEIAVAAVKSIEKLKPPEAVDELIDILKTSKDEELKIACCRALGRIARADCIQPLTHVLTARGFLFRNPLFSSQVRATAAFALGLIPQAKAIKTLAGFVNDPDERIRTVAREVLTRAKKASRKKRLAVSTAN